ncbi:unnamed protein product [Urochloa humidicola]
MGWAARFLTAVSLLGGSGDGNSTAATAARLAHLLAFATAWGAGLCVTFIGGIVMFNSQCRAPIPGRILRNEESS